MIKNLIFATGSILLCMILGYTSHSNNGWLFWISNYSIIPILITLLFSNNKKFTFKLSAYCGLLIYSWIIRPQYMNSTILERRAEGKRISLEVIQFKKENNHYPKQLSEIKNFSIQLKRDFVQDFTYHKCKISNSDDTNYNEKEWFELYINRGYFFGRTVISTCNQSNAIVSYKEKQEDL